jgi:hypothetical protein
MVLPTVPTVPRGAMIDGMLQAMGAEKANPPSAIDIQVIAMFALVVKAAPITAIPNLVLLPKKRTCAYIFLDKFTQLCGCATCCCAG